MKVCALPSSVDSDHGALRHDVDPTVVVVTPLDAEAPQVAVACSAHFVVHWPFGGIPPAGFVTHLS